MVIVVMLILIEVLLLFVALLMIILILVVVFTIFTLLKVVEVMKSLGSAVTFANVRHRISATLLSLPFQLKLFAGTVADVSGQ
jgi:hypothetical protein